MIATNTHILALLFGVLIAPQSACTVTFFEHGSYGGEAFGPYPVGEHNWGPNVGVINDLVSSLKVLGTDGCCVTVFQDADFSGYNKEYCNEEVAWIGDEFNDKLSSFKLAECLVTFYEHSDYNGMQYGPYSVGSYSWVPYIGMPNDQISSLKVSAGIDDCCATVYEHGSYGGTSKTFCSEDIPWIGAVFNDQLSSFTLTEDGNDEECLVTFYQHGSFAGASYGPYSEGEYKWGPDVGLVNDDISSLKVSGTDGCCVTVYQDANYAGYSKEFCNTEVAWVGDDFNDKLSSFRID